MKQLLFLISVMLFFCCRDSKVEQVYKNKSHLMSLCKDKALLKSRGSNFILFKTIKKDSVNEYYINIDNNGKYKLYRDTIQYNSDIINSKSIKGSENYKVEVCNYVKILNEKLEAFYINGFTTEFSSLGESFIFYMKDGKRVIYIPDKAKSFQNEKYQKSLKKINKNWYYID